MEKHSERAHALLAASKSDRWMHCTPSARLEDAIPEPAQTAYAAEGELAHELAQIQISHYILEEMDEQEYNNRFDAIINNEHFNEEMLDEVPKYVDYVETAFLEAKTRTPDAMLIIETQIDYSRWVQEGFGTLDAIIIADQTAEVIDLKYGKGVLVSAEDNPQLKLYAVGALERFGLLYDTTEVLLTIAQIRRDNISSYPILVSDLYDWADNELAMKAKMAWEGIGEQVPGEWCKFCLVKAQCRALAKQSLETAKDDFADPHLLTDDEIANILKQAQLVKDWVSALESYALEQAKQGRIWPGFKLVAGMSRRKWADENKVANKLAAQDDLTDEDIYTKKLNGITIIEKKLGKKRFADVLGELVIKPEGAPTLVEEGDKRPALGVQQAQIDFQ